MDERSVSINIGGKEYELLLTTRAAKEITKKFGGLENLGDSLSSAEDIVDSLDIVVWLIALLANQAIDVYNIKNKSAPKEHITEEEIELLTSPRDFTDYNGAVMKAIHKGVERKIESEENPKNVKVE